MIKWLLSLSNASSLEDLQFGLAYINSREVNYIIIGTPTRLQGYLGVLSAPLIGRLMLEASRQSASTAQIRLFRRATLLFSVPVRAFSPTSVTWLLAYP